MCNVPDAVREWIADYLNYQKNCAWLEGDVKVQAAMLDDVVMMSEWLDSLPEMPQPDWDSAPEWAEWWAMNTFGDAFWFSGEPQHTDDDWIISVPEHRYEAETGNIDIILQSEVPIGIDWRLTKQRRPDNDTD